MECRFCVENPDYLIFADGNVYSRKSQRMLKPYASKYPYLRVDLHKDGKGKSMPIHRLVATAFIPNPENKGEVNHINGIKTDNRVENLEWVTHKENVHHAYKTGLNRGHSENRAMAVEMYSMEGMFIAEFSSAREAAKHVGISDKHIGSVCNGNRRCAGGYIWKHKSKKSVKSKEVCE